MSPVCPVEMSCLSRGRSVKSMWNDTGIRSGRPGCPGDSPPTVPGTLLRHTDRQIPLCVFCLSVFFSGKKKAHNHKFFCPVGLGTTAGLSRGFPRVCPWDKSGENLGQTRVFSLFYTVEARFHRVCPWDNSGDEGRHRRFM